MKGCPAYEEVRQPSMDNFDIKKYEGKWYEQKFHDWTQFKEVYDTTLDIKVRNLPSNALENQQTAEFSISAS